MKVFIVLEARDEGCCGGHMSTYVRGVYSTEEKAKEHALKIDGIARGSWQEGSSEGWEVL
jgi:hypothetical protein